MIKIGKRVSEILQKNKLNVNNNRKKSLKKVSAMALAATVAFSTPSVMNVLNDGSPLSGVEVYAAETTNLMNTNETLTTFNVNHNDNDEHWVHRFHNDGDIPVDRPDFDLNGLKYVVKFPDELAHLLDNTYMLDYLLGNQTNFGAAQNAFTFTGIAVDKDGAEVTIHKDDHKPFNHISVNKATNSIEFDFASFYEANELDPYFRQDVNGDYFFNTLGFETPIVVSDEEMLDNGTYTFKSAIVRGESVDLNNISNAYAQDLTVDYSTDPEPEVDKEALTSLVDKTVGYDASEYTVESFKAFTDAHTAAETVLDNEEATQEEVDKALATLQTAVDGLEKVEEEAPVKVDKEALTSLVDETADYDAAAYTEESFDALTEARTASEAVLANEEATQEEVDEALATLKTAVDGLEKVEEEAPAKVDKKALTSLVDETADYDAAAYTEESFDALTEARTAAEAVLANEAATQAEVEEALAALQTAVDGLEEVKPEPKPEPEVDSSELEALIEKAKQITNEDYTSETFAVLSKAIEDAETLLAYQEATHEAVTEMLNSLQSAMDGLEKVLSDEFDETDEEDSQTIIVENDEHGNGHILPQTATNTYTMAMIGGLLAAIGGALLFVRKRVTKLFN